MDTKDFAERLTERLRKRSEDYRRMKTGPAGSKVASEEEMLIATSLDETADCIEEALATFDE